MASDIILDYHDTILRESDVALLNPGCWLNDNLIAFYLEHQEIEIAPQYLHKVAFLNPSATQMSKFMDVIELKSVLSSLKLPEKDYIFIPVNNNTTALEAGGSHWSLVFYDRSKKKFLHYDSYGHSNYHSAKTVCDKFRDVLVCPDALFEHAICPQQSNSFDCGVYVICFVDYLYSQCVVTGCSGTAEMSAAITPASVLKKRGEIKDLIFKLAKK